MYDFMRYGLNAICCFLVQFLQCVSKFHLWNAHVNVCFLFETKLGLRGPITISYSAFFLICYFKLK